MNEYTIYKIHLIPENDRVIYVGMTSRDPIHRLYCLRSENNAFKDAMAKYGHDCFRQEVIETASSKEEAFEKEEYWTRYYMSISPMFNIGIGSHNLANKTIEELRDNYNKTLRVWQKEHGNWLKGKKMPEEMVRRMSEQRKGKPLSEKALEKLRENHPTAKPVYCLNNDKIYKSAAEAGRDLGLDPSSILKTVKHQYTNTKGYVFGRPFYLTVDPDWK